MRAPDHIVHARCGSRGVSIPIAGGDQHRQAALLRVGFTVGHGEDRLDDRLGLDHRITDRHLSTDARFRREDDRDLLQIVIGIAQRQATAIAFGGRGQVEPRALAALGHWRWPHGRRHRCAAATS